MSICTSLDRVLQHPTPWHLVGAGETPLDTRVVVAFGDWLLPLVALQTHNLANCFWDLG